ncbi:hypothetical protein C8R43DRAFT_316906 [Mycena crocata]|nr:hypothetical protein C8R43DRAFT_316906 [Mycena crocata]
MFCFFGSPPASYTAHPSVWQFCAQPPPACEWYPPATLVALPTSYPPLPVLWASQNPHLTLNPQLSHYRSDVHPHIDWNTTASPLSAVHRHGRISLPITASFHLEQPATSPPVGSATICFAGTAGWSLAQWGTIHVARTDGSPLRVGDVLNAIHLHVTRRLTYQEITGMQASDWVQAMRGFNQRVQAAGRQRDPRELFMQRLDLLEGHTLFDGIHLVGGEFQLSLL